MTSKLKIGVIGYGYWGPNIVRNFGGLDDVQVVAVCDPRPAALKRMGEVYPHIRGCTDFKDITRSNDIDVVAVVTPVFTHHELAKDALSNGKHVFVEKPFTSTVEQSVDLIETAERVGRLIMVDHTFIFTGAVRKIKELIDADELGQLCYFDSTRVNLGLFQRDINVIWDLAPHDFSIVDHLVPNKPLALQATGVAHFGQPFEDVAYVIVHFENDLIAHFTFNWLSPVKIRQTLVGGSKKMLVWNDLKNDEKVKVYDKSVHVEQRASSDDARSNRAEMLVNYRIGDMHAPVIKSIEALRTECQHFVDCIRNNTTPINDGTAGLRVVEYLAATDVSLKNKGALVEL